MEGEREKRRDLMKKRWIQISVDVRHSHSCSLLLGERKKGEAHEMRNEIDRPKKKTKIERLARDGERMAINA